MNTPTTVADALAAAGVDLHPNETVAVLTIGVDGSVNQRSLADVAGRPLEPNMYYSTGAFARGTDFRAPASRTSENVVRVLEVPLDFDIKDYAGLSRDEVLSIDDATMAIWIDALAGDVKCRLGELGVVPHRIDVTGNGVSAFLRMALHQPDAVPDIRRAHRAIVERINVLHGSTLADPQVTDAGTRIMRIPGSANHKLIKKGAAAGVVTERRSYTLERHDTAPAYDLPALIAVAGVAVSTPPARAIARTGAAIGGDDLEAIVGAVLPYWQEGIRHSLALGLAAMLAKATVPENQASAIVQAVADAAGDDEPGNRLAAVRDTYARYRRGHTIEGYFRLRTILDADALAFVDATLQRIREATWSVASLQFGEPIKPGDVRDDAGRIVRPDDYPEPPEEAFYGWFGEYVDLIHPTTESSRGFHLMAALTVVGASIGRRIGFRNGEDLIHPNLYTVLVGPTGIARKSTTIKRAIKLPRYGRPGSGVAAAPLPYKVRTDVGSGAAMVHDLADNPQMLLAIDEMVTLISYMKRKGETLGNRIIEAYDNPDELEDNVKNNPAHAERPSLSILTSIQPGRLERSLEADDIESGFANRFLFVFGTSWSSIATPPEADTPALRSLWDRLAGSIAFYGGTVDQPHGIRLTEGAAARYHDWYAASREKIFSADEDSRSMAARAEQHVMKLAVLYAVADRALAVELEHLDAAIALTGWLTDGVQKRLNTWGVQPEEKLEAKLIEYLKRHKVARKSRLRDAVKSRGVKSSQITQAIDALVKLEVIAVDSVGNHALADWVRSQTSGKDAGPVTTFADLAS